MLRIKNKPAYYKTLKVVPAMKCRWKNALKGDTFPAIYLFCHDSSTVRHLWLFNIKNS